MGSVCALSVCSRTVQLGGVAEVTQAARSLQLAECRTRHTDQRDHVEALSSAFAFGRSIRKAIEGTGELGIRIARTYLLKFRNSDKWLWFVEERWLKREALRVPCNIAGTEV
jgi:hypothetical protein